MKESNISLLIMKLNKKKELSPKLQIKHQAHLVLLSLKEQLILQ